MRLFDHYSPVITKLVTSSGVSNGNFSCRPCGALIKALLSISLFVVLPFLESRIKTEVLQMHTTLYTEFPIRLKPTPKVTRLGAGLITNARFQVRLLVIMTIQKD